MSLIQSINNCEAEKWICLHIFKMNATYSMESATLNVRGRSENTYKMLSFL